MVMAHFTFTPDLNTPAVTCHKGPAVDGRCPRSESLQAEPTPALPSEVEAW